ncbi:pilus assembly protein [Brevundimonas sp.]|uniref:TadE/TadG family type IV pilus assembly protein n=1 Tax=Brevundimonas sp. TaxID=1871086 RepID=UPI003D6D660A
MTNGLTNGLNRLTRRAQAFAVRFAAATRGNVAMMFALALPGLLMITLGAVDIHQASKVKATLQDALDAAALAAARSRFTDSAEINRVGLAALKANMPAYFKPGSADTASFVLQGNNIVADARVNVKVLVANIVLPPYGKLLDDYLPVGTHSEVLRASRDVEVALALDITGSMAGQPLTDLKAAASELIDIVVQDQQTPFYSKIALAPYAVGVNVDTYADQIRGTLNGASKSITGASWVTGTIRTVSGISKASTATVSATGHGFVNGDRVVMWSVNGMSPLNGVPYQVQRTSADQFRLYPLTSTGAASSSYLNTSGLSNFWGSAYVAKCVRTDCGVVLNVAGHGLVENDYVRLADIGGLSQLNGSTNYNGAGFRVTKNSTAGQLVLDASRSLGLIDAAKGGNAWTSGGKVFNGADGHLWRVFPTVSGMVAVHAASTCVSERVGAQAYTDAAPTSAARVGRSYPDSGNACPTATLTPLSSDRAALKAAVAGYEAKGSTAGQIGIAWGWYMVSPNFGALWPADSQPAAYNPSRTLKVAILMTDGEFNTPFRDGVIASDAGSGSSGTNARINLTASNGDPFSQSVAMCQAMRAQSVVVYAVGFNIDASEGGPGIDTAREVLAACASSPAHNFLANSGGDLKEAFKAIGRDITRLRIAR